VGGVGGPRRRASAKSQCAHHPSIRDLCVIT
jgi:hypothetical protein